MIIQEIKNAAFQDFADNRKKWYGSVIYGRLFWVLLVNGCYVRGFPLDRNLAATKRLIKDPTETQSNLFATFY